MLSHYTVVGCDLKINQGAFIILQNGLAFD